MHRSGYYRDDTINNNIKKDKKIFHKRNLIKNPANLNKLHKIKYIKIMDKVHVYMCFHITSIMSTAGNRTRLFSSPFLNSTSWFFILAKIFRNEHVAAFGTALRSAAEKNEIGGYVTVPCSSKMTQRSSTADWLKF